MATTETPKFYRITEGAATIVYRSKNEVFYNKAMQMNRDVTMAAVRVYNEWRNGRITQKELRRRERAVAAAQGIEPQPLDVELQPQPLRILEALGATGLRSIRFAREVSNIGAIVVNDLDAAAVASITRNIRLNNCDPNIVKASQGDAAAVLFEARDAAKQFDVVDLDPYGSPAMFLDPAVQAVADGGLLAVTATDMPVLAGHHMEAAWGKYTSQPARGKFCQELSLRILLHSIAAAAGRYKRTIQPVLSIAADHYVRVFVIVRSSNKDVVQLAAKEAMLFTCKGCHNFHVQPIAELAGGKHPRSTTTSLTLPSANCPECGWGWNIGGPFWMDPIHDESFVSAMLEDTSARGVFQVNEGVKPVDVKEAVLAGHKEQWWDLAPSTGKEEEAGGEEAKEGETQQPTPVASEAASEETKWWENEFEVGDAGSPSLQVASRSRERLVGILRAISNELVLDEYPLSWDLHDLSSCLHLSTIPDGKFRSALSRAGYRTAVSHCNPKAVKTDAPSSLVYDVMRTWEAQHPAKPKYRQDEKQPVHHVVSKPVKHEINLSITSEIAVEKRKKQKMFIGIPEARWGPKTRATGFKTGGGGAEAAEGAADSPEVSDTEKRQRLE